MMFHKSLIVAWLPFFASSFSAAKPANPVAFPAHALALVIIPWEPNGADYKFFGLQEESCKLRKNGSNLLHFLRAASI